jgi:hypothetical protein
MKQNMLGYAGTELKHWRGGGYANCPKMAGSSRLDDL